MYDERSVSCTVLQALDTYHSGLQVVCQDGALQKNVDVGEPDAGRQRRNKHRRGARRVGGKPKRKTIDTALKEWIQIDFIRQKGGGGGERLGERKVEGDGREKGEGKGEERGRSMTPLVHQTSPVGSPSSNCSSSLSFSSS